MMKTDMKRVSELMFRAVGFLFSAVIIVLALLASIKLAAVNDRAAGLEKEIDRLKTENEILRAGCESSMSLEEIENYAQNELGMVHREPGQIYHIEHPGALSGEDPG